jgi:hypothetical protein
MREGLARAQLAGRENAEQSARESLLLIGSALPRSRGWLVRAMFGIEDFRRKLNGNRVI